MDDPAEELKRNLDYSSSNDMVEAVAYQIWGAAVTTTRAFKKVEVKIEPKIQFVFVVIDLGFLAKRMKRFHEFWLERCSKRCKKSIPPGWRLLAYYKREVNDDS